MILKQPKKSMNKLGQKTTTFYFCFHPIQKTPKRVIKTFKSVLPLLKIDCQSDLLYKHSIRGE